MRALPVGFPLYLLSLLAFIICIRDHRLLLLRFPLPPPPSPARLQTVPEKRSVPWWRGGVYSGGRGAVHHSFPGPM